MKKTIKKKYYTNPFPEIVTAVNVLVDFLKPTFGPGQGKVMIADEVRSYTIDDGIKIAEEFGVENDLQNSIINFVKAAARKTNERVGDGTTGCMIILQAILKGLGDFPNFLKITGELKKAAGEAKDWLISKAQKIESVEDLQAVAEVSCNDKNLASMIGQMMFKVGVDGAVAVEEGSEFETKYEVTEGIKFDRGFVSPHMATSQERPEAILNDPYILLFDKKLGLKEFWPFLEKLMKLEEDKRNVLLVADQFEPELITALVVNKLRGLFTIVAVNSPGYGPDKSEYLKDLAIATKATIFDETKKPADVTLELAGRAERVVVKQESCTVIKGSGDVSERVEQLKANMPENSYDAQKVKDRIARMKGGVAVIKVGGMTDEEIKANYEKAEDAVNATRAAMKSGVVRGAGVELSYVETSSDVLNSAMKAPGLTLLENMGLTINDPLPEVKDPVDVLVAQVESAVSIACLLLSTKGVLTSYYDVEAGMKNEDA